LEVRHLRVRSRHPRNGEPRSAVRM
jgi:hypothetical protein